MGKVDKSKYYDEHGKLKPGHPGLPGAGRKPALPADFYEAARAAVTPEEFAECVQLLVSHFKRHGSPRALEVLRDTLGGTPVQTVNTNDSQLDNLRAAVDRLMQQSADDSE